MEKWVHTEHIKWISQNKCESHKSSGISADQTDLTVQNIRLNGESGSNGADEILPSKR